MEGMRVEVTSYFDVWGSAEEGFEVNDQTLLIRSSDKVYIPGFEPEQVIDFMKSKQFIKEDTMPHQLLLDYTRDDGVEIQLPDGYPLFYVREVSKIELDQEEKDGLQEDVASGEGTSGGVQAEVE